VFAALRRAEPVPFLEAEIRARAASGFPPAGELIVLEAAGAPGGSDAELRTAVGAAVDVHGPSLQRERSRWLLQARDLRTTRLALRRLVQDWRDRGARVRVDADPLDL
jgi:primosomal protein N'